ncbi:hypothetical protein D3C87_427980 [compost metagenome]
MKFKQLFIAALLVGNAALAQTIAVNTTDEAGNKVILTKNHKSNSLQVEDSVAKNGLAFFSAGYQSGMAKGKNIETYFIDLDMFHNDNKLGCINQSANNITLILEDGSKIECFQMSDTDCGQENFKAAFALSSKGGSAEQMVENFKKLTKTGISKIKVKTSESSLEYKIAAKSTDYMKSHFALIEKTLQGSVK